MIWIQILGVALLFTAANFVWYWQGFKDGRRQGYTTGREVSRQAFWKE